LDDEIDVPVGPAITCLARRPLPGGYEIVPGGSERESAESPADRHRRLPPMYFRQS
jgi:hypothetical protein